jgi:hypothetical protein
MVNFELLILSYFALAEYRSITNSQKSQPEALKIFEIDLKIDICILFCLF